MELQDPINDISILQFMIRRFTNQTAVQISTWSKINSYNKSNKKSAERSVSPASALSQKRAQQKKKSTKVDAAVDYADDTLLLVAGET